MYIYVHNITYTILHIQYYIYNITYTILHYVYIYILCEQNDPCSGCYQFDTRAPSVCVFQRFNGCNGGAAYFP